MSPKRWSAILALGWITALAVAAAAQPPPRRPVGDGLHRRLYATVVTRNDHGRVFCALWRGREGYPTDRDRAAGEALDRTIVNRQAECEFPDVTPGEYALAAFHDENANNDLDRNFIGIPSEGTGASNNAYNLFGPPSYDDARFSFPNQQAHRITLHIRYR